MAKKKLVIVESPSKAKTINKYLGSDYIVDASVGHIKNLPSRDIGIDIENGFKPKYVTIKGKASVIKSLKAHAKTASEVFIATDPDREGEAIAAHIQNEIAEINPNIRRVLFTEITKRGIADGMSHPKEVDAKLVESQQARRVMDRIIGYRISPFLWKAFVGRAGEALSAGRVQSVALKIVCEREAAIGAFEPIEYWTLAATFRTEAGETFTARLMRVGARELRNPEGSLKELVVKNGERSFISDAAEAERLRLLAEAAAYAIADVTRREMRRNPSAPFTTSTIQQEASKRLRFSTRKTMILAQQLYEGVDIGEEAPVGLITYMRTDSTRLSDDAIAMARDYIGKQFGAEYLPEAPPTYRQSKSAQDAHEAIRPTSTEYAPAAVRAKLDRDQAALYELVWNRFIASQMQPAIMDQTTVDISSLPKPAAEELGFRASGSTVKFKGFLAAYEETTEEDRADAPAEDDAAKLPAGLEPKMPLAIDALETRQSFTKPPARFSESSLVKELDQLGIGRPSTYASIITTIQDRQYVEQKERRLFATQLGMDVSSVLQKYFPDIFSVEFTAAMETELDTIADGEQEYGKVLNDFYAPFTKSLQHAEDTHESVEVLCEKCGKPMAVKSSRFGPFLACTGYPECKNTKSLKAAAGEKSAPEPIGEKCPTDEGELVIRTSRYGKFIGCANYPKCKYSRPMPTGIQCPKCGIGELAERRGGKFKRAFWGCARYPECDFISNHKPINMACPACENNYIVNAYSRTKGEFVQCPKCKSEFTKELQLIEVDRDV